MRNDPPLKHHYFKQFQHQLLWFQFQACVRFEEDGNRVDLVYKPHVHGVHAHNELHTVKHFHC